MTATVPKIPDPLVVLRRAEQKHTGEEPGDLDHLAEAVRTQIVEPLTAGDRPVVGDVQVKQLLADKQRLEAASADEQGEQPTHRHQFELDPATGEHKPCSSGKPWIRDLADGEPVEPDVEPLDALFARIRDELGEAT